MLCFKQSISIDQLLCRKWWKKQPHKLHHLLTLWSRDAVKRVGTIPDDCDFCYSVCMLQGMV